MGAFQAGFQLGGSMWDRAQQMSLAEAREAREAEEFARKKQDWQKADELEAELKGLSEQITNPNASNYRMGGSSVGLKVPGQAAPADAAPGEMPPTDFSFGPAAAGGLKAPKAFALADTPGAAVAPAPDAVGLRGSVLPAGGVSLNAGPSASEEQAILAKIALLKGDIQGFNSARQAGKAADKDAVFAEAMKAPMPEVIAAAPKLNSMGIPLLYTGKSKDGKYTFLKTEADGYTPVDGSQFTLNESQMRQFYAASQLADKGFGADAMNLLSTANKDVADYIGKWNSTQSAVATANNTAQGKVDEAEYKREKLKIERAEAGAKNGYYAAQAGIANERLRDYRDERDRRGQAAELVGKFESLSPADQAGPVGQGLIRQFNMLNVMNGGQVSMGGAGANKPRPDLKFQANGDSGFFMDSNGYPVGRQDPTMGLVPFGMDPRGDKALMAKLDSKGVKVVSVEGPGGRPVWGYASTDGRVFSTPEEALSPPKTPLDSGRVGALSSFRDELGAAQQQLVAAGKSGDPQAIAHWSQKVMGLKRMHQDAAKSLFGTRADEYLSAN